MRLYIFALALRGRRSETNGFAVTRTPATAFLLARDAKRDVPFQPIMIPSNTTRELAKAVRGNERFLVSQSTSSFSSTIFLCFSVCTRAYCYPSSLQHRRSIESIRKLAAISPIDPSKPLGISLLDPDDNFPPSILENRLRA